MWTGSSSEGSVSIPNTYEMDRRSLLAISSNFESPYSLSSDLQSEVVDFLTIKRVSTSNKFTIAWIIQLQEILGTLGCLLFKRTVVASRAGTHRQRNIEAVLPHTVT